MTDAARTDGAPLITLGLAEVEALARDALCRGGAHPDAAAAVARRIVEAEARGLQAGGLRALPDAIAALRAGRIDGAARPRLLEGEAGTVTITAGHGFAAPALDLGVSLLLAATLGGVAVLVITDMVDCGDAAPLTCDLAGSGRMALVRGADGQEAAARPGLRADRPERLAPGDPALGGMRARLAGWRQPCEWPTAPVGGPVAGMLRAVASLAGPDELGDRNDRGLGTVPPRRDAVAVPAGLVAGIANA